MEVKKSIENLEERFNTIPLDTKYDSVQDRNKAFRDSVLKPETYATHRSDSVSRIVTCKGKGIKSNLEPWIEQMKKCFIVVKVGKVQKSSTYPDEYYCFVSCLMKVDQ